jgi:hypothetical protein
MIELRKKEKYTLSTKEKSKEGFVDFKTISTGKKM